MKTLIASEGKYYTNSDHTVMGKEIYMPESADLEDFHEITESTFKKYLKQQEEQKQEEGHEQEQEEVTE